MMVPYRVIIQARLSSQRLPAKALLPLAGLPVVVLSALRAANRGARVVVATSTDASDDELARVLTTHNLSFVRGSLDDVLDRFVSATNDLNENDIVVRLTADNVVTDGDFIECLVGVFNSARVEYLGTRSPRDGLPYGLSAEVFSVRALRVAARSAVVPYDREHVTPWIRRHANAGYVDAADFGLRVRYGHLRCTIDSMDDYLRLAKLFAGKSIDAVEVGWRHLVEEIAGAPDSSRFRVPFRLDNDDKPQGVLALGTAQLGMEYGAANTTGQPTEAQAVAIVREAIEAGVTIIDTARVYGLGESRLGGALRAGDRERITLVTKLDPLVGLGEDVSQAEIVRAVDASVFRSCWELRCRSVDFLLLHRWQQRFAYEGAVWQRLLDLRDQGVIGRLGASVSTPAEAVEALHDEDVHHLQVPYNVLDWRWEATTFAVEAAGRPDVMICARSVFLQGILVSESSAWPVGIVTPNEWISRLNEVVAVLGRSSRSDLCLAYVLGAPWITSAVVGVETLHQLTVNAELSLHPPLSVDERKYASEVLGGAPERLLNPAWWAN